MTTYEDDRDSFSVSLSSVPSLTPSSASPCGWGCSLGAVARSTLHLQQYLKIVLTFRKNLLHVNTLLAWCRRSYHCYYSFVIIDVISVIVTAAEFVSNVIVVIVVDVAVLVVVAAYCSS